MSETIGELVRTEAKKLQVMLTDSEVSAFNVYAAELLKWNAKVNLTAITKNNEIAIKHFVDSLVLVPRLSADDSLLDIGSGAGLPSIPLKIMLPHTRMTSVDAVAKKIHFQRHVIRLLNLTNIEAVHARIETLQQSHQHIFSVITSRAFTRLDRFVALAAPLLREDGLLIAMKGGAPEDEIAGSDDGVSSAGFEILSVERYSLPMNMGERVLTLLKRRKSP